MASLSEIQSLEEISYKSKIKFYLYPVIIVFLFSISFLNYFPVGEQLKGFMKKNLAGTACNPDYDDLRIEWILPKIVVSGLNIPAGCLGRIGDPIKFTFVSIQFNFISFAPFGIPFKIQSELNGQPMTIYYVQGFGERVFRIKDQPIVISRLQPVMGANFKLSGNVLFDLTAKMANGGSLKDMDFKMRSTDFQLPSQNIQGFTTPNVKLNEMYIEAKSENSSTVKVDKFIVGDPDSPIRANLKGQIDLQQGAILFSNLDLKGEIAFTENFNQTVPLVDLFFQNFTQKDGFYQIRIGGNLGQPKLMNP